MSKTLINNIIFLALGVFIFWLINSKNPRLDPKPYQDKIEHLQQKVDSVEVQNKELRISADSLQDTLLAYSKKVAHLNDKLDQVKYEYEKKLAAVDTFTNSQLQQFFTDRYGQYSREADLTRSQNGN